MEIQIDHHGEVLEIGLTGRLDGATVQAVEEAFLQQLDAGAKRFLFNLEQLDYISSAGLRVMLLAAKKTRGCGGKIALYGLNDGVREVFEISGFHSIFSLYPSQSEALPFVSS